jgi:hypothetical protein
MSCSIYLIPGALLALLSFASTTASAGGPTPVTGCRTLDSPGAFLVTAPIVAGSDDCFVVAADFVDLNLGGFTIESRFDIGNAVTDLGIAREGVVVRNGTIKGFNQALALAQTTLAVAADLSLEGQGVPQNEVPRSNALELGDDCRVERVQLTPMGGKRTNGGIVIGERCIVASNTVTGSTDVLSTPAGDAIGGLGSGSVIQGNRVSSREPGIFFGGSAMLVDGNNVQAFEGIRVGPSSLVAGNTVGGENCAFGIVTMLGSTLTTANAVSTRQDGIDTSDGMNYVSQNSIENENGTGFGAIGDGEGSLFFKNTLSNAGFDGILLNAAHSIASNNSIVGNKGNAVLCPVGIVSAVRDNQAKAIGRLPAFDDCVDLGGNVVLP